MTLIQAALIALFYLSGLDRHTMAGRVRGYPTTCLESLWWQA